MPTSSRKAASIVKRLSTTESTPASTLSNPLVTRAPNDPHIPNCVLILDHYRLKQIDVEVMRRLHTKVNLIPVIAKADTLTDEEIISFKQRVCLLPISHILHTNFPPDPL